MYLHPLEVDVEVIQNLFHAVMPRSRFTWLADVYAMPRWLGGIRKGRRILRLTNVRLRRRKFYCGQHPGPCRALFPRPHRRGKWLEGADWVGMNDLINDVLDEAQLTVDVFSASRESDGLQWVRKGRRRRWNYGQIAADGFVHWDGPGSPGDYVDRCGQITGPSRHPHGTPGLALWRADEAREQEDLLVGTHAH